MVSKLFELRVSLQENASALMVGGICDFQNIRLPGNRNRFRVNCRKTSIRVRSQWKKADALLRQAVLFHDIPLRLRSGDRYKARPFRRRYHPPFAPTEEIATRRAENLRQVPLQHVVYEDAVWS